jgi:hypothetical protein
MAPPMGAAEDGEPRCFLGDGELEGASNVWSERSSKTGDLVLRHSLHYSGLLQDAHSYRR